MNAKKYLPLLLVGAMFCCTPPKGDIGPQGAAGQNGTIGTNGTNGTNGTAGATGATGATGTTGASGPTGAKGATGASDATYSDWKALTWTLDSQKSYTTGQSTQIYVATFKEPSITDKILTNGNIYVFFRKINSLASYDISLIPIGGFTFGKFNKLSDNYTVSISKLENGMITLKVEINFTKETAATVSTALTNEKIGIQSYVIGGK